MALKIDHVAFEWIKLCTIWEPDMETLLKSKGLWKYMKTVIPYPTNDQKIFLLMERRMRLWGSSQPISRRRFIFTSVELTFLIKSGRI
jgi:hypothetical protein